MIFKEMFSFVSSDMSLLSGQVKIIMCGNSVITVQNFKKIISYTDTKIVFKCNTGFMTIEGEAFCIKELSKSDVIITGKIKSIVNG